MLSKFFYSIAIIAFFVLALNTMGSLFYFIYLWGGTGLSFAPALWQAALTWLTVGVASFVTFIISIILSSAFDK